jgi:hypothetical protein
MPAWNLKTLFNNPKKATKKTEPNDPAFFDPFGGAKPRLLRRGEKASLRVNPEQARVFRPGSRRVDRTGEGFL